MFLRSFLLAILVAAFIGTTSACLTQSQIETMFKKYTPDGKKKWSKGKVPLLDIGSTLILFPSTTSKKLTLVCNFASLDIDYLSMISLFRSAYTPQYRIM